MTRIGYIRYLKSDFLEAEPGLRIQIQVIYDVLPGESRKGIGNQEGKGTSRGGYATSGEFPDSIGSLGELENVTSE